MKIELRPLAYHNIDGTGELGFGVMMLGFATIGWMQKHTPPGSAWHSMYVFVIYMAAMLAVIHYGTKAIKERITYPRTGFVEYRRRNSVIAAVLAGVAAMGFAAGVMLVRHLHWHITRPAAGFGLLFSVGYAIGMVRAGWAWWKLAVPAVLAVGAGAIAVLPENVIGPVDDWFDVVLGFFGALSLLSGAISFVLYIRHTQAEAREQA